MALKVVENAISLFSPIPCGTDAWVMTLVPQRMSCKVSQVSPASAVGVAEGCQFDVQYSSWLLVGRACCRP